jgi:hypothetical protein
MRSQEGERKQEPYGPMSSPYNSPADEAAAASGHDFEPEAFAAWLHDRFAGAVSAFRHAVVHGKTVPARAIIRLAVREVYAEAFDKGDLAMQRDDLSNK